jgi:hypothetical protein
MTTPKKPRNPKLSRLELSKETIADLTEEQAELARGGAANDPLHTLETKIVMSCTCPKDPKNPIDTKQMC